MADYYPLFFAIYIYFAGNFWPKLYQSYLVDFWKIMKKSAMAIFITYVWTKVLLGLVVHPYKSVREVSRNKILMPIVFSPIYSLVGLLIVGRVAALFVDVHGFRRELIAIILSTGLLSILLWQLLLLYLLLSFLLAFRKP